MRWNMDLCILCKRCLTNIHFILLYVDPKKSSFFFPNGKQKGNESKQRLDVLYLYFCISSLLTLTLSRSFLFYYFAG